MLGLSAPRFITVLLGLLIFFYSVRHTWKSRSLNTADPLAVDGSHGESTNPTPSLKQFGSFASAEASSAGYLHLLITANSSSLGLCRTIMSAALTNQPIPNIIAWNAQEPNKMENLVAAWWYLRSLDRSHDNDLAIVVLTPHTWFQTSAIEIIDRYYTVIDSQPHTRENAASAETIIFAAQEQCWPLDAKGNACEPLPKPFDKFLNADFFMGPVSQLRQLLDKAETMGHADKNDLAIHQSVLTDIWGEEEPDLDLGLDFGNNLVLPAAFVSLAYGMQVTQFGTDISYMKPVPSNGVAFEKRQGNGATEQPNKYLLYQNLQSGIAPAIVQQRGFFNESVDQHELKWENLWYQKEARGLLEQRQTMSKSVNPLGVDKHGKTWYSSMRDTAYQDFGFGVRGIYSSLSAPDSIPRLEFTASGSELWNFARGDSYRPVDRELDLNNEQNLEWRGPTDHDYGKLIDRLGMEHRRGIWLKWEEICPVFENDIL